MRIGIDLASRQEGDAVQRSMQDPLMKTAVVINGLLQELPTPAARSAVLKIVLTANEPQLEPAPRPILPRTLREDPLVSQAAMRLRDGTTGD